MGVKLGLFGGTRTESLTQSKRHVSQGVELGTYLKLMQKTGKRDGESLRRTSLRDYLIPQLHAQGRCVSARHLCYSYMAERQSDICGSGCYSVTAAGPCRVPRVKLSLGLINYNAI
jgi:hypothetical protein